MNDQNPNSANDDLVPAQSDSPQEDSASSSPGMALTIEQVMNVLKLGHVNDLDGLIRWSSNYTFLTSVTHESIQLPVVYKPQKGERPLWDFPDGTLCFRERAAFLVSEALDWQIVPPTVLRDGPRGLGSMQFFVDHDPEYHYFEFDESMLPQLARLAVFDAIVNNADRKGGHCIVDSQEHLWGIDHGICFHATTKLRTVIWDFAGEPVPQVFIDDVKRLAEQIRLADDPVRQELDTLLSPREVSAFIARLDKLLEKGQYPEPGLGPSHPWPPV